MSMTLLQERRMSQMHTIRIVYQEKFYKGRKVQIEKLLFQLNCIINTEEVAKRHSHSLETRET